MKYMQEFRDLNIARHLLDDIGHAVTREWVIMEVCGGQTHSIIKNGIDQALPTGLELAHGPGCPVCVTPLQIIDQAIAVAGMPGVILATFGDMLRVPGTHRDLFKCKSEGADVRVVYSPLDAVQLAREHRDRSVVFLAVGFETTAPNTAMAVSVAHDEKLDNFSMLVSHVLVPPAMRALLSSPANRVNAYLAAGHVCAVMGWREYEAIAAEFHVPIVVTGFEPVDILQGILQVTRMLEGGRAAVENAYHRVVRREGNLLAQERMNRVFELCDRNWRGIGLLPGSGLKLRPEFSVHDAALIFDVAGVQTQESERCISGQILQGLKKPIECPAFAAECTPQTPLGATMVSSEGACAAYYAYHRRDKDSVPIPVPSPGPLAGRGLG